MASSFITLYIDVVTTSPRPSICVIIKTRKTNENNRYTRDDPPPYGTVGNIQKIMLSSYIIIDRPITPFTINYAYRYHVLRQ